MGAPDIISKLNTFLKKHHSFEEECYVVYLMVEIRKILEKEEKEEKKKIDALYPLVKFYCDWILHNKKEKITTIWIEQILEAIDRELPKCPENFNQGKVEENLKFIRMDALSLQLDQLFEDYALDNSFLKNPADWANFLQNLIEVLIDQPILPKKGNIESFSFVASETGFTSWIIKFKKIFAETGDFNDMRSEFIFELPFKKDGGRASIRANYFK